MKIKWTGWALVAAVVVTGFSSREAVARNRTLTREDRARCQADCGIATEDVVTACLEAGGTTRQCAIEGRKFKTDCMRACRGQGACEQACRDLSDSAFEGCIADGGTTEKCEATASQILQTCVKTNCTAPPPCSDACIERALTTFRECVDGGETPPACFDPARGSLEECLADYCNLPEDCNELCTVISEATATLCLEGGLGDFQCRIIRSQTFDICFATRCEGDECKSACFVDATVMFQQCRAEGGTAIECATAAFRFLDRCSADCDAMCDGFAGIPCPTGFFCKHQTGTCQIADDTGVCRFTPRGCPDVWDPVCGCDGVTYGNECEADAVSVAIDHTGECGP